MEVGSSWMKWCFIKEYINPFTEHCVVKCVLCMNWMKREMILHFYEKAHLTAPRNFVETAWIRPSIKQVCRGLTAQLYFETTEADVNFTKGDEEMAGNHHMPAKSQVTIHQLFRIWSTNPVNISTLLSLTSPRTYRWWGEGEEGKLQN